MGDVKDLKQHAQKILKENIEKAETIARDAQSQLESELSVFQDKALDERITKCKEKIAEYETATDPESHFRLAQWKHKLEIYTNVKNEDKASRFDSSQFDESDPNVIDWEEEYND